MNLLHSSYPVSFSFHPLTQVVFVLLITYNLFALSGQATLWNAHERGMALTTDCWSDPHRRSYICVTGTSIDDEWELHCDLLGATLDDRHTAVNIQSWMLDICRDCKVEVCFEFDFRFSFHLSSLSSQVRDVAAVTSDNANDITKTINDAGFHRGACLCHELDLSVNACLSAKPFADLVAKTTELVAAIRRSPK